eukprot:jgi/Botrbrau1/4018/Bobra.0016s0028.1
MKCNWWSTNLPPWQPRKPPSTPAVHPGPSGRGQRALYTLNFSLTKVISYRYA